MFYLQCAYTFHFYHARAPWTIHFSFCIRSDPNDKKITCIQKGKRFTMKMKSMNTLQQEKYYKK